MKTYFLLFAFLFVSSIQSQSDDEKLAFQFFQLREYDKAEILYKKLYDNSPEKYYDNLFDCYLASKNYDQAILISKQILKGKQSKNKNYQYNLGYAYFKNRDSIHSIKEWQIAIEEINTNLYEVDQLIHKFYQIKQWELVEKLILTYRKKSKDITSNEYQLYEVYLFQKKYSDALNIAIDNLDKASSNYMNVLSSYYQLTINPETSTLFEKKVYTRLTKEPNSEKWNDIAMWTAMQMKNYEEAMLLAKSYEKRNNSNGQKVYQIAQNALSEKEYEIAIEGFDYISKMQNSGFSKLSFEKKLASHMSKLDNSSKLESEEIIKLTESFNAHFVKHRPEPSNAETQLLYSKFMLNYKHHIDSSLLILNEMLAMPYMAKHIMSRAKLDLADLKLMSDEIWDASLLYGQVDKAEKDGPLGEEARFKNSKVFYYNGDYELAEDLLSILKSSTTELIANDALQLAQFIQDNSDDDNLKQAMAEVSKAELLLYQNKTFEALKILNEVKSKYPSSDLLDDILLIEGNSALKSKDYKIASDRFKQIYINYPRSVISDRALFEWAKIEEEQNKNSDSAKEAYLNLMTKYKDSIFVTESRKRLRALRGEKFEEEL